MAPDADAVQLGSGKRATRAPRRDRPAGDGRGGSDWPTATEHDLSSEDRSDWCGAVPSCLGVRPTQGITAGPTLTIIPRRRRTANSGQGHTMATGGNTVLDPFSRSVDKQSSGKGSLAFRDTPSSLLQASPDQLRVAKEHGRRPHRGPQAVMPLTPVFGDRRLGRPATIRKADYLVTIYRLPSILGSCPEPRSFSSRLPASCHCRLRPDTAGVSTTAAPLMSSTSGSQ